MASQQVSTLKVGNNVHEAEVKTLQTYLAHQGWGALHSTVADLARAVARGHRITVTILDEEN